MHVTVKEVGSPEELKIFYQFQNKLYRKCKVYVPTLDKDQVNTLLHDPALNYCIRKLWLAYSDEGKVVGRIQGIINPRYNDFYSLKRVRFGWFDFERDMEIARALLDAVEKWGKEEGMREMHGPLAYNTLGRQGMLVEGFENIPPVNCLYNFPYYPDYMEKMGFSKECDWVQYLLDAQQGAPAKLRRLAKILVKRYNLKVLNINKVRRSPKLKEDLIKKFFAIYNECFKSVHNFIPLTKEEEHATGELYFTLLRKRLTCIVMDEHNEIAAFGICTPSFSRAFIRAKGKLFPFGWFFILMAYIKYNTIDLMMVGSSPAWNSKGLSAIFHSRLAASFRRAHLKAAVTNPQIDTNTAAVKVWESYEHKPYMRRRCWIKEIK